MKIYISVDIEGITGVIHWNDTDKDSKGDYEYFRKIMAGEVNAAIEGACEAGATEIVVRDAHGNALNILPTDLDKRAKLLRNWADSPICMMEGIDSSFHAAMFIGYHARAGVMNATLKHTLTGKYRRILINDLECSEAAISALIAGHFNVPVVLIAGDRALCDEIAGRWPQITTVAVKDGIGEACLNLHPEVSREKIRAGAQNAVKRCTAQKPIRMNAPFVLRVEYHKESDASRARWFPGANRLDAYTVEYTANTIPETLTYLYFC